MDEKDDFNLNISPEMLENLIDKFKQTTSSNDSDSSTNIDLDTVLKIKSIFETFNKSDDPGSRLLFSLKPYLRESRQKKIDQYANLFKLSSLTSLFKNEKGD